MDGGGALDDNNKLLSLPHPVEACSQVKEGSPPPLTFVNAELYIRGRGLRRPKHPNKHIERAVAYAEAHGWRFVPAGKSAHIWGRLFCAFADRDGCRFSVNSTPRVPEDHAERIRRIVATCPHRNEGGEDADI
mgnify:CR=1 FL=1